jgi:F-type H+-transporting ATPase subunit b
MSVWTLSFQVANFLVLAAVLYRFLFKPVTAMIARRQVEIESARKEAESGKRAAEESRAHYEKEVEKLHTERETSLAELRAQAARDRAATLEQARSEAARILESAKGTIAEERGDAAARLADAAVGLAADLSKRLLQQAAGPSIAEILLQRVCDHLESMPTDRLRALREELARGSANSLEVATAPSLTPEAEARFAGRIATDLDTARAVRFVADPDLIAGAELRLPHTKISFSWRDGLAAAREELVAHADGR